MTSDSLESQEYPREHLQRMASLVEYLRPLPAQLLDHYYSYEVFGSWYVVLRYKGIVLQVTFDGRDHEYILQRSEERKRPYAWGDVLWRRIGGDMDDAWRIELVDAMKRAVGVD